MHVPDEASIGPVQAVAIVGAALRFPGAWDPASFHELTVSGRRMFREFGDETAGGTPPGRADGNGGDGLPAGRAPLRAALLDELVPAPGLDADLTGGITSRHVLATETAGASSSVGRRVPAGHGQCAVAPAS